MVVALLMVSVAAGPIALKRHVPEYATRKHQEQAIRQDRNVSEEVVQAIIDKRNVASPEKPRVTVTVLAIPGQPERFLVIDADPPEGEHYGLRLFLFEARKGELHQLDRSAPMQDGYVLNPILFSGGGRVFIVAGIGTEYSWGDVVWEVEGTKLRYLGAIEAAVPGEENDEAPTPFANVLLADGTLLIRYDTDLVFQSAKPDAPRLRKPVTFRKEGTRFVPVRDARRKTLPVGR
jgi:hypothetical protein